MNILFTYPTIFYPERGGVERVTDNLAKELTRRGHNIYYLHTEQSYNVNYKFPGKMFFLPDKELISDNNIQYYNRVLKDNNINFIIDQAAILNLKIFYSFSRNLNVKVISVIHNPPLAGINNLLDLKENSIIGYLKLLYRYIFYFKLRRSFIRRVFIHYSWLVEKTDFICLLSPREKEDFKRIKLYVPDNKFIVISNPNTYQLNEQRYIKEKLIIYVGRVTLLQKRVDRLIKIWRKINTKFPDWKFCIVGGGSELESIKMQSKSVERLIFTGFIDPREYYKKASILCMASDYEGWGMVLTESMSYGCVPILYDSFSAASQIIDNNINGVLVSPFKENEYINKLSILMSNPSSLYNMSEEAKNSIRKYSVTNIVNLWESFFKENI